MKTSINLYTIQAGHIERQLHRKKRNNQFTCEAVAPVVVAVSRRGKTKWNNNSISAALVGKRWQQKEKQTIVLCSIREKQNENSIQPVQAQMVLDGSCGKKKETTNQSGGSGSCSDGVRVRASFGSFLLISALSDCSWLRMMCCALDDGRLHEWQMCLSHFGSKPSSSFCSCWLWLLYERLGCVKMLHQ